MPPAGESEEDDEPAPAGSSDAEPITGRHYGEISWSAGDVIGCMLDLDAGVVEYTYNGGSMGVAFKIPEALVQPAPVAAPPAKKTKSKGKAAKGKGKKAADPEPAAASSSMNAISPALSLEDGESMRILLRADTMLHGPPEGYAPVADAVAGAERARLDEGAQAVLAARSELAREWDMEDVEDEGLEEQTATVDDTPTMETEEPAGAVPPVIAPEPKPVYVPRADVAAEALDLSRFGSADELEALGLDRLKAALMFLGMKCGGSARDRAERLWSVQDLAVAEIPKKLLVKK